MFAMSYSLEENYLDLPGGLVVNNLLCNARDAGPIPGLRTKIPRTKGQQESLYLHNDPSWHNWDLAWSNKQLINFKNKEENY